MAIRILAPEVIDKIAAGEVLDRPANLVKELVENSLDAGADQVEVEFENGGRDVCVRDNGRGMCAGDLELALERHATSKIAEHEDLFRLHTYGFRGEALASIAAVSELTLTSRTQDADQAVRLRRKFLNAEPLHPISASQGTEVRVSSLFENVPARLKFLKSDAAEHGQIKTTLKALGLGHPQIGFNVRSRGQLLFHWPKDQSFRERALTVLDMPKLFAGEAEIDDVKAEVLVSSPQDTVNVNRSLWFFVQGRWVQDRSLTAAVMEAYRNLLMHGEYPTVVVRLTLDPENVDVNVHPTKSQVKFHDGQKVFRVVSRAVRQILEKAPWLETPAAPSTPVFESTPTAQNLAFRDQEFARTQYSTKVFPLSEVRDAVASYTPSAASPLSSPSVQQPQAFRWADLHVIGQLNQTYIVAQDQEAMYLVDQHAAHERVVFEQLMESFQNGKIEVQNLLLPLVLDLPADEVEALTGAKEQLEQLGLSVDRMGPESLAVQAIPGLVSESAVSRALQLLAFELLRHSESRAWEKSIGEIFASMACHSVVRAGQTLSVEQMKGLLDQMDQFSLSSFCPHGRPVFIKRKFSEVERDFGRIV